MCPQSPKEKSWCHSSNAINLLSSPRAGACCESELTEWMKMAGKKVLRSAYLCLPRTRKSVHSHIRLFFFCLSGFQKSSSSTVLSVALSLLSNILFFSWYSVKELCKGKYSSFWLIVIFMLLIRNN